MRKIPRYDKSAEAVYDACLSGVADAQALARLSSMRGGVGPAANEYAQKAAASSLYQIPATKLPLDAAAVGNATRRDLKELYERQMVGVGRAGRLHYDRLLIRTPHQKCPYCGLGQATTLDHYLPKSRFPQFSVNPDNLIPSCKDCQSKKGRYVATTGSAQTLHPYFDDQIFFRDKWIFGRVIHTVPISVAFVAQPPAVWSMADQQRAKSHFQAHDLARRYAIESTSELAVLRELFLADRAASKFGAILADLTRYAASHTRVATNSWQSALYSALAEDPEYCSSPAI